MLVSPSLAAERAARLTGGRRLAGFGLRGRPAGPVVVSSSPAGGLDGRRSIGLERCSVPRERL